MPVSPPCSPVTLSIPNETFRTDRPDTVIDIETSSSHTVIEILNDAIPEAHRTQLSPQDLRIALASVDEALHEIETERKRSADEATNGIANAFALLIEDTPGTERSQIIALDIPGLEFLQIQKHSLGPDLFVQRAQVILGYLGEQLSKLTRNEFEGDLGRWASNLTISGLRTGLVTGALTVIRQLLGFTLEKLLQSSPASPLTRNVIGAVVQSIGPLLNVLGAIRDESNGTANQQTRLARLLTLTLSILAFTAAATVPAALPALASFGSQMAFYTFAQDLVSLFCPTGDNAKANLGGTAAAGVLNGTLQFLSFTGMNYTAPHSGPGPVMAQGNEPLPNETEGLTFQLLKWMENQEAVAPGADLSDKAKAERVAESVVPVLVHDILRGAYNAGADVAGQILMGEAMYAFSQESSSGKGFRVDPMSLLIPTAEQAANQLLSTNAIRTSVGQIIMAVVISASRYFSTLPIPKEVVDHIVNLLVAAVVFAVRPGATYVNARSTPA
jgi:hypothetical protein